MLGLDTPTLISRVITLIIAFTVHEYSHARVADSFGDDTPRANGRLTLNPLVHLDLIGTLMLLVVGFGWAKPVPVNPYALSRKSPAGMMWVSLAGPASNFALAILAAIPLRFGWIDSSTRLVNASFLPTPYELFSEFIFINLLLMLFNLLPLGPLDGEKIFSYFAPPPMGRFLDAIRPYGSIILIALLVIAPRFNFDVLGWMMVPALPNLWYLLLGGAA